MWFKSTDLAILLEAVYRVEQTDAEWLKGVLEAARPGMDQGMGIIGFFSDLWTPGAFRGWGVDAVGLDSSVARKVTKRSSEIIPAGTLRAAHTCAPCVAGSHMPRRVFNEISWEGWKDRVCAHDRGVVDVLGLNGFDATGQGCGLVAWLPRAARQPSGNGTLELWERIAVHLATAARLRRKLAGDNGRIADSADAILSLGGRVEHATGAARDKLARSVLRDAVLSVDRARTRRNRLDSQETSELWQALFAGRWSLVDHFDSDGRHFVVAHRNEPATVAPIPLTAHE